MRNMPECPFRVERYVGLACGIVRAAESYEADDVIEGVVIKGERVEDGAGDKPACGIVLPFVDCASYLHEERGRPEVGGSVVRDLIG